MTVPPSSSSSRKVRAFLWGTGVTTVLLALMVLAGIKIGLVRTQRGAAGGLTIHVGAPAPAAEAETVATTSGEAFVPAPAATPGPEPAPRPAGPPPRPFNAPTRSSLSDPFERLNSRGGARPYAPTPSTSSTSAPSTPTSRTTSRLMIPVQGVRPEELTDTYNESRGGGQREHNALDIPAPRGTPVLAAASGTVLKRFQSERGGVTLYVLGPDRRTIFYYAHLDGYAEGIREGQPVDQGAVLGYVGDSGNAGAGNCHLHFEITTTDDPRRFWDGTPRNPYPLLLGRDDAPGPAAGAALQ